MLLSSLSMIGFRIGASSRSMSLSSSILYFLNSVVVVIRHYCLVKLCYQSSQCFSQLLTVNESPFDLQCYS